MAEHIGTVTNREEKIIAKGENTGQPFLKVTLEPDKWTYSLFDGQHIKTAKQNENLKVIWEEDGKYRSVVDVQAVEGQQAVVLASGNELRERRITRTAIAKSLIEGGGFTSQVADFVFNWVWETTTMPYTPPFERCSEDIQQSEDTLVAEIKKLADGQTIRNAMDKLEYTEAKLSDCDAGKLAVIRDEIKNSMLV